MSASPTLPTTERRPAADAQRAGDDGVTAPSARRLRGREMWTSALCAALGLMLWSEVCGAAFEIELMSQASRLTVLAIYVAPLVVLGAGVLLRRPAVALAVFPISLLPPMAVLEPLDARYLNTLRGGLTLCVTMTLYMLVAARLPGADSSERATPRVEGVPLEAGVDRRFWRIARHVIPRVLLIIGALVIPLLALYGEEGRRQLASNFPRKGDEARFLIHAVHLFVALLAIHVGVLSPSINRHLELYELRERFRRQRAPEVLRRRWWVLGGLALALVVLVTAWTLLT